MTDAEQVEQDRTYYMQRTVFAKGPDGRVRLTKGDETPGWYQGKYDGRPTPDVEAAEGGEGHPAVGGATPLTQEQADALAGLTEDEQAQLAALTDEQVAALDALTDEQLAELAASSSEPEAFGGTDAELIDGSVDAVLERVGTDRALAQRALDAETAKGDKARSTLVEPLTAMVQAQA